MGVGSRKRIMEVNFCLESYSWKEISIKYQYRRIVSVVYARFLYIIYIESQLVLFCISDIDIFFPSIKSKTDIEVCI